MAVVIEEVAAAAAGGPIGAKQACMSKTSMGMAQEALSGVRADFWLMSIQIRGSEEGLRTIYSHRSFWFDIF